MKTYQGHLLIAAPQLLDVNFRQTVTLLVQHNEDGALGLVLNRPSRVSLSEAWSQVSIEACERQEAVHEGGPCLGPLMILHGDPARSQVTVADGLHFSADPDDVSWLVEHGVEPIKFFAGYAGWAAGQLEAEMKTGSWLLAPASPDYVFGQHSRLWAMLLKAVSPLQADPLMAPRVMPPDPSHN
jgi:putative transcriptional regulator